MTFDEYQKSVEKKMRPGSSFDVMCALGLTGEAGEVAELVKKSVFHSVSYRSVDLVYELGDVLWYLTALAKHHGVSLEYVARCNIEKLSLRYPDGFVPGGGVK